MTRLKSFVFSIEALIALAAAVAIAAYPLADAGSFYGEVHMAQLAQDLLEVTLKNPENAGALASFASTGNSPFLEGKYAAMLKQLGNYCLRLEARGKSTEVNCGNRTADGAEFSAERIFWDGAGFTTAKLALSFNRMA